MEDATTAWEEWQKTTAITQSTWSVASEIVEILPPDGPSAWKVLVTRTEPATERIHAERLRRSTFILVSNDPRRSARELLEAYKTQFVVEQDHAVVKGPLSVVPLFLKDTRKITAYVYVVYMARLLWQCMQAVMRQNQERLGMYFVKRKWLLSTFGASDMGWPQPFRGWLSPVRSCRDNG